MGNVHNSNKRAKLQVYEEGIKEDHISNLPDSLLRHIISFLPMKSLYRQASYQKDGETYGSKLIVSISVSAVIPDLRLLKCLCLSYIGLEDVPLSRLLYECPLLEDLLEIHAPNLVSLKFSGAVGSVDYIVKVSSRPKIVLLNLGNDGERLESVGGPRYPLVGLTEDEILVRILEDIRTAKVLCLRNSCVQLLSGQDLQRFHTYFYKLKRLDLEARLESDARSTRTFWESQQCYFPCLIHSLESIKTIICRESSREKNTAKMMKNHLKKWANEIKLKHRPKALKDEKTEV
ncbi:hypothetical protein ACLOJK_041888 [Asimina triloba]